MDIYCEVIPLDKELNIPSPAAMDLENPLVKGSKLLDK